MARRLFKILLYVLLALLLVLMVFWLALQNSGVQTKVADYVASTFTERYDTKLDIGKVDIEFFRTVKVHDVYVEDQQKDTLAYIGDIEAKISLFSLLRRQLVVSSVSINDGVIDIHDIDGVPNYNFLLSGSKKPEKNPPTSNHPWDWDLKKINLNNLKISYSDSTMAVKGNLGRANIGINDIAIDSARCDIGKLAIKNTDVEVIWKPSASPSQTSMFPLLPFEALARSISTENCSVRVAKHGHSRKKGRVDLDDLDMKWDDVVLQGVSVSHNRVQGDIKVQNLQEASGFTINELRAACVFGDSLLDIDQGYIATPYSKIKLDGKLEYTSWEAFVQQPTSARGHISLNNTSIHRRDMLLLSQYLPEVMDYRYAKSVDIGGRVHIRNGTLKSKDLRLNVGDALGVEIDVSAKGLGGGDEVTFDYLLSSAHTHIPSLQRLFPTLEIPTLFDTLGAVKLHSRGQGSLSQLQVDTFHLVSSDKVAITAHGNLKHLDDTRRLQYDLQRLHMDLHTGWLPLGSDMTRYQNKLDRVEYHGSLKGNLTQYDVDGRLTTPVGVSDLDVVITTDTTYSDAAYKGRVALQDVALDQLLDDDSYGLTTVTLDVDGSGITAPTLDIKVKGKVDDLTYNYHSYKNILIDGSIKGVSYDGIIESQEDGTRLRYNGILDFNPASAQYKTTVSLDSLDLYRLNMVRRPFTLSGTIKSDLEGASYDELEGDIYWTDIKIRDAKAKYQFDKEAVFSLRNHPKLGKVLTVRSPFIDVDAQSDISIDDLYPALVHYLNTHTPLSLAIGGIDTMSVTSLQGGKMQVTSTINEINPFFGAYLEEEVHVKSGVCNLTYEHGNMLDIDLTLDSLCYGDYALAKSDVEVKGDAAGLVSDIRIDSLHRNGKEVIPLILMQSTSRDRIINTIVDAKDEDHVPRIMLGSRISEIDGAPLIQFHDSLVINKERWFVAKRNQLMIASDSILAENLEIFRNNQSIKVESVHDGKPGLLLTIEQFRIDEVNKILSRDDKLLNGKINGTVEAHDLFGKMYFTSDLAIHDVVYNKKPVGDLSLKARQDKSKGRVLFDFDLVGKENDALGQVKYDIQKQRFDGFLELAKLEMRLVDPFVEDIIEESTGHIYGDFQIAGTVSRPDISGNLLFDEASTVIKASKTRYNISDQKVRFNKRTIQFDGVTFTDMAGRSAVVQGNIRHRNFKDMFVSLKATSKGMQFLNTTEQDNAFLYGNIYLNTNLNIFGPPEKLRVEGFATAVNGSEVFMSPFSDSETVTQDDFIVFGAPKTVKDSVSVVYASTEKFPVDVNVGLVVEEDSKFNFIVNPITGDKLQAQGNANLRIGLKKNGTVSLDGTYVAEDGYYLFSYGPIQKKFKLDKGGTVSFAGDPLTAKLDIKARYDAYVSPYELLKSQISAADRSKYSKKRDIDVVLGLTGNMLTPQIKLDIQSDSDDKDEVATVLDQKLASIRSNPNELNNQVFGLLMLETFISVDNTISGFDATENIVLGSVSSLITNQLNNLTKGIEGVNIAFDVQNYSKEDNRGDTNLVTELNLAASQTLFDDRVTVRAEGNFDLESGKRKSRFSRIAGDFIIEWKLNDKGNYIVKFFNKTDFDNQIDENKNKTGVSISIKKNLD